MNTFWPSITQSLPSRRARVWIERTSLPPLGSVTASAASFRSPGVPKHSGAQRISCSSVAAWRIAASASAGITIDSPIPAQPQNSSSIRIGSDSPVGSPASVAYRPGSYRPARAASSRIGHGSSCARSNSAAAGRMTSRAKR